MEVVKRDGKWTLERKFDGLYFVKNRGQAQVKIMTDKFKSNSVRDETDDAMMEVEEVEDFEEAKQVFESYITRRK